MFMILLAAVVSIFLSSFITSIKIVSFAVLVATIIALLIYRRSTSKSGAPKPLALAGGVMLVGLATLVINMYVVMDAELSPTREIMIKSKEIERILAQQDQHDRFAVAKAIVDNGKSDMIRKRLGERMLETFRGADYRNELISGSDLQSIESLLNGISPSPAGTRSCSVYFAHVYIRQTGPADVYQVLSEYPNAVADCGGKVEYLSLVRRRCAKVGEWHAQCSVLLPRNQLLTLRDARHSDSGTQRALDTLLSESVGIEIVPRHPQ